MKLLLILILALTIFTTACASQFIATPASAPAATSAPQSQVTATPQLPPPSKCQSKVSGRVTDPSGQISQGATIEIKGTNFSSKTLSDDNGLYGFAGLCSGTYSFTVTLPGQSAKAVAATAKVDGANSAKVDLALK
jgi:hypothetical protein